MLNKRYFKLIMCFFLVVMTVFSSFSTALVGYAADEYEAFLNKLGYYESRNKYNVMNSFGYMGRWQMGMESLKDIGFVDSEGNWTALANSMGVYSTDDFLNTPAAQDYAIRLYDKKLWSYIKYFGDDKYIGTTFDGIEVTLSGLVAAAHLVGAGGVHEMFMTGRVKTDALGNKATFYLKNLAGYDISEFLGADISKYLSSAIKSQAQIDRIKKAMKASSKINLYGNASECNYLIGTDFSEKLNNNNFSSRNKDVYSVSIDESLTHNGYNSLKIVGKEAGKIGVDIMFNTDTNGNVENDGYIGDYKKMTLSFYAKSSVENVNLYWRWGYSNVTFTTSINTKEWKKYSVTFTKKLTDGSKLYLYLDKKADVNLSELMLVDGEKAPTLFRSETSKCIKTVKAAYLSSYGNLPSPTRKGYKFEGWYTSKSGGEKVDSSTPAYDKSLNLYAHWTKISKYIPEKTTVFNGHYYTLFTDDLTWEEAKKACERMGGHLVSINSQEENQIIVNLCKGTSKGLYWIGAYSDDKGKWKWVSDEKFDYTSWDVNQPSKTGEKYAQIYGEHFENNEHIGKWNDANSSKGDISWFSVKNVGYICEFEPEKLKATIENKQSGSTYKVFDTQISWYNAKYFCEVNGGNLLTINDKNENEFVSSLLKDGKSNAYWIGSHNITADGKYCWVTGEKFDYANWNAKNPTSKDATSGVEHFASIEKPTMQWNDFHSIGSWRYQTGFVMEIDESLPTVSKIIAYETPDVLCYNVGDSLNTDGLVVAKVFSDTSAQTVDYGYSCSPTIFTKSGLQKITVEYQNKKTSFNVYVFESENPVRVTECKFRRETVKVGLGKTKKQKLVITPKKAECKYANWSSSDESIATVDENGVVTGVSYGKAIITAKTLDRSVLCEYNIQVRRTFWQWTKYYVFFGWTKE